MKYIFETRMEVRDYECDIEGIVNNANYLHYTEHTRHLFLRSLGVSFAKLHEQGIDAVIHSMKLQYKVPLVELVCLINGQLGNSPEYDEAFKDYI